MKRLWLICGLFLWAASRLYSQTVDNNNSYTINAFDVDGKAFTNKKRDVVGSPMLNPDWGKGIVKFKNGYSLNEVELQFNLVENELYFKKNNITYAFVDPIQEFVLTYTEDNASRISILRCGYPLSGENTNQTFYEVVKDGSIVQLLKKTGKVVQTTNKNGQGTQKEYRQIVQWYVYDVKNARLEPIKKDKSSLKQALPSFTLQIDQFAEEKNYKFRNEEEIIELISSLNSQ